MKGSPVRVRASASQRFPAISQKERALRSCLGCPIGAETFDTAIEAALEELRGELGPAELQDRERLGKALVEGGREPPSEAEAIRAELARQELRVDALRLAEERARAEIRRLVDTNCKTWRGQARRELAREKQRYEAAISKLQAAREALVDVATLASWLGSGDIGEASTTLPFSRTLEELRLDCEQLAAHPDTPDGPQGEPRIDIGRLRDAGAAASLWVRK